jgi:hypothetical protein
MLVILLLFFCLRFLSVLNTSRFAGWVVTQHILLAAAVKHWL